MMFPRSLLASCAVLLVLIGGGCESVRRDFGVGVKEKLEGPAYRTEEFEADMKVAFGAAREAVAGMGYQITRSGAAQGVIEAYSRVAQAENLRSSRQARVRVVVSAYGDGARVAVLFTEMLASPTDTARGGATETAIKDSAPYDAVFERLRTALGK
jgi:hypothetical protein